MLKYKGVRHTVVSNVKNRCPLPGVSWKLRFKSATGKVKESLKIIMLTCSFNDVGIQPLTLNVKHRCPHPPQVYAGQ